MHRMRATTSPFAFFASHNLKLRHTFLGQGDGGTQLLMGSFGFPLATDNYGPKGML